MIHSKPFSFCAVLNMSVQKQTLRANNKALAQSLAKTRQELRQLNSNHQDLQAQNQELKLRVNHLTRIVGIKDGEIEDEVQRRIRVSCVQVIDIYLITKRKV